jgi:hypothetical protein
VAGWSVGGVEEQPQQAIATIDKMMN